MIELDNKNVRASNRCPLCEGYKDTGLVACWPCYRLYDLRNGNLGAEARIDRANEIDKFKTIRITY